MDGLYTFLEGLLNKDNKKKLLTDAMFRGAISKIKPYQECLKEGMMEVYDDAVHLRVAPCWSNDEYGKVFKSLGIKKIVVSPAANYSKGIILWPNMADIYHDQTMPTWVVEIKGDTAYIFGKDYNGKAVPVTCHIGPYTLNAIKNTKIKKIEALSFILRDKGNAVNRLSDISLHSTNKQPVFPFRFYETWELENVTFKSDSRLNSVEYFRYNRSLIIKKNVKLQNEMVNIAKIGDIETLGYDYSAVKRFKCIIPAENPLCNQIIKWLEQKKECVAKDEDLKKLIGNIPPLPPHMNM